MDKDSIVYKIINKAYLHKSIVMVASRPAAIAKLRHKANKIIEVLGFLNDQILEYFDHYPFLTSEKSAELKAYLSSHPNILHMCYLPIHAAMVAFLFEAMGEVPKTETEIYTHFTRFTLIRNLSKSREFEPVGIDLHSLTGEEQLCFKEICQLAFEKTLSSKQVLDQDEASSYFQVKRGIDSSLGLITIDRTAGLYGYKDIYTFMHLTFQEYLAAYHISTLSDEEQLKLIQEHGDKNHMLVVWKFYCGLVKIKAFENKFKSILHKSEGNILFHIQCAYETQQKIACAQLLKAIHYHFQLADKYLSTPDFTAIGYVTNTTVIPTKLSLLNCNINVEAIDALLSEMEDRARHSLQGLHVATETVDSAQMECIKKLLANLGSLKDLSIEAKMMTEFESPTEVTGNQLTNLTELSLINIDIGPLVNAFVFSDLTKLKLYFKGGSRYFGVLVAGLKNLKDLDISSNNIDNKGAKLLAKSLKNCNSLERINLSNNNIKSSGVAAIFESSGVAVIFENLKELDVSSNSIDNKGAKLLAKSLKDCNSLERINISNNDMTISGVATILNSIRHCYLKVKAKELTHEQDDELLKHLEQLTNLQSLEITVNLNHFDSFCTYSRSWNGLKELNVSFLKHNSYIFAVTKFNYVPWTAKGTSSVQI